MNFSRAELKYAAKERVRTAKPHPMLVTLIYVLIPIVAYGLVAFITLGYSGLSLLFSAYFSGDQEALSAVLASFLHGPAFLSGFLSILLALFSVVLNAGFTWYGMSLARGQETGFGSIFEGFADVGRIIAASILMGIFVFLWSLLFFFPGIIALYRYRMTYRILRDNPHVSALQAISISKTMMRGYKMSLFVLDLSFLGWAILSTLTLGILGLWVSPYQSATEANFYDAIQGGFQPDAPPVWEP